MACASTTRTIAFAATVAGVWAALVGSASGATSFGATSTALSGLAGPAGLAIDSSGTIVVAQSGSGGEITAAVPSMGSYTTSPVASATSPWGVAIDAAGVVYYAEPSLARVMKAVPAGGSYTTSAVATGLGHPKGVAVDASGNLFVTDDTAGTVTRVIIASGATSTVVTGLNAPAGVAVDGAGALYIAEGGAHRVTKATLSGGVYTTASITPSPNPAINTPSGVTVSPAGIVYVAEAGSGRVRELTPSGGGYTERVILAGLDKPAGIALDPDGNVFVSEQGSATQVGTKVQRSLYYATPAIVTHPADKAVDSGQSVTFTVAGTGSPTPSIAWQVSDDNGASYSVMAGQTGASLTINPVQVGMHRNRYRAVLTNTVGTVTSDPAILDVLTAPEITTPPTNVSAADGTNATFTIAITGTPLPTLQWQVSTGAGQPFTNMAGQTSTSLVVAATVAKHGYRYRAVVTNAAGSLNSPAGTLDVQTLPAITTAPVARNVFQGASTSFAVAASGNPAPTVQWERSTDGGASFSALSGETGTTLWVLNTTVAMNDYRYRAVLTNVVGTTTTTPVRLGVTTGPFITTEPVDVAADAGGSAEFTVAANGDPTPTVQWQVSQDAGATFTNVAGATNTTLTVAALNFATMNDNRYRAVLTNTHGSSTSAVATLTVRTVPVVTTDPADQTGRVDDDIAFTATATGNPVPTRQWQVSTDGGATFTDMSGENGATLNLIDVTTAMSGNRYRVRFTNGAGSATSAAGVLTVLSAPVFTTQPADAAASQGGSVHFDVALTGGPAPTLQWQRSVDGGTTYAPIAGATGTRLTVTALTSAMHGYRYRAAATNSEGAATSAAAQLSVHVAPVITQAPADQNVDAGAPATFAVVATGSPAPTYQWQVSRDAGATFQNIPGATAAQYTVGASSADMHDNRYRVVAHNAASPDAVSAAATLSVAMAPTIVTGSSVTVAPGATATFEVQVSGRPTPVVQWQRSDDGGANYTDIPGATGARLQLSSVTTAMNGVRVRAVASSSAGSIASGAMVLTVAVGGGSGGGNPGAGSGGGGAGAPGVGGAVPGGGGNGTAPGSMGTAPAAPTVAPATPGATAARNTTMLRWTPVAGARYRITLRTAPMRGPWKVTTVDDSDGEYRIDVPAGSTVCATLAVVTTGGVGVASPETCSSSPVMARSLPRDASWQLAPATGSHKPLRARAAGATLTIRGVNAQSVAVVARTGAGAGKISLWLGKKRLGGVSLASVRGASPARVAIPAVIPAGKGDLRLVADSAGVELMGVAVTPR